jgi:hypothetical protein
VFLGGSPPGQKTLPAMQKTGGDDFSETLSGKTLAWGWE